MLSVLLMVLFASQAYSAPITIRGIRWLSYPEEKLLYDEWCEEYNRVHPDVKVEIEWITTGYDEKKVTSFAGGQAPDFYFIHTPRLPLDIEEGMCVPLDEYIDGPNGIDAEDLFPAIWEATTYKGKRYGFSDVNGVQILYYNKKMFREAGLEFPDENWTWQDLAETAEKLTKDIDGDGRIDQYGFQCDEYNRVFTTYVWSMEGKLFDNEQSPEEPLFNGPVGVEAAKYLSDLVLVYGVAVPPGVPGALGYREAFGSQKVAMILDGSWMINTFSYREDLEYGTTLVPKGKVRAGWYDVCTWVMSSQTKHPDITWDVIKFLSGPDRALALADYGGVHLQGMPSWQSCYEDPRWKPHEVVVPVAEQIKYARPEVVFWNAGKWYWDMLNTKLQEIVILERDPKAALDELAEETVKEIIQKMPR